MLMLQQPGKKKTVDEIAEIFSVSRRTIFRDFNALQEINFPITWDKYAGYGVIPGYKIPPLMFTSKELATIMVGLNFVKSQVDEQLMEDAKGVELKIKNVLPIELKEFMESLEERTVVDPYLKYGAEKKKGGDWYLISSSISQKRRIQFLYKNKREEISTRKIDPYILVFYEDHWNTIGFSHQRGEIRNFVLDRMTEIQILDERIKEKGKIDLEALIFRFEESAETVELLVEKRILMRLKGNLPAKIFKEKEKKPKKIQISFRFDDLDFINEWLLQFGNSIEVIGPKLLKEKRKVLLTKMLAQKKASKKKP